jgi:hypothetical protein
MEYTCMGCMLLDYMGNIGHIVDIASFVDMDYLVVGSKGE